MTEFTVNFSGSNLLIGGRSVGLPSPIAQAYLVNEIVVVLLDPDSFTKRSGQFPNLVGVDTEGRVVWTAELPTSQSGDRYYKIASTDPLVVYSVTSFECTIDPRSGRIVGREFFK